MFNKEILIRFKRNSEILLYTNPKKYVKTFVVGLTTIITLLIVAIVNLLLANGTKVETIVSKEGKIQEQSVIIQEKDKKIEDLKQYLPAFYEPLADKTPAKFNSIKNQLKVLDIKISEQNIKIVKEQKLLLSANSYDEIKHIAVKYGLNPIKKNGIKTIDKKEALIKCQPIPKRIAFSQYIQESGGFVSSFSKKFNNPFGIMNKREPGRGQHFTSLDEAVSKYSEILNTSKAMEKFRIARYNSKGNDLELMAKALQGAYCVGDNTYAANLIKIGRSF